MRLRERKKNVFNFLLQASLSLSFLFFFFVENRIGNSLILGLTRKTIICSPTFLNFSGFLITFGRLETSKF